MAWPLSFQSYTIHTSTCRHLISQISRQCFLKASFEKSIGILQFHIENFCQFCLSAEDNEVNFGTFLENGAVTVHYFCMLLASGLCQNTRISDKKGILGFLLSDIKKELNRGSRLRCCFCHGKGATIGCCVKTCRRAFHLSCGRQNGTMHQFFDSYRSYCREHRLIQVSAKEVSLLQSPGKRACAICMCNVTAFTSCDSLFSLCCRRSWFHRTCMQSQASKTTGPSKESSAVSTETSPCGRRYNVKSLTAEDTERCVRYIEGFVEDHGLSLPGRIPGYHRTGLRLLPSYYTKTRLWKMYTESPKGKDYRAVGLTSFKNLWQLYLPNIVVARPMTDLCNICQTNNNRIMRSANTSDPNKLALLEAQRHHISLQYALSAGMHYFKCPLCNAVKEFQTDMLKHGIYIPDQDASWEREPNAFQELLERHNTCDASECLCPEGRKHDADSGKYELLLCSWCGSYGSHKACKGLYWRKKSMVCTSCAEIIDQDEAAKEKQKDAVGQRTGGPQDAQSSSLSASSLSCCHEQPPSSHTVQVVEVDEQILSVSTSDPHLYHRASMEQGMHSIHEPENTSSQSCLPQTRGISWTETAKSQEAITCRRLGRPCQNPELQQALPSNDSIVIKRKVRRRKVELLLRDYQQFLTKANSEHIIIPTAETILLSESLVAQTRGRILRSDKDTNQQDVPLSVTCGPRQNPKSSEDAIMIKCRRGRSSENKPVQKQIVNRESLVKGRLNRQNSRNHHQGRSCRSGQKKLQKTQTWRPRGSLSQTSTANRRVRHHLTQCSSTSYPVNATESKATDHRELWNICNSHLTTANTEELKIKSFGFGYKEPYILLTRVDRQKELTSDKGNMEESQKKWENPICFSVEMNENFDRAGGQKKEIDLKRNSLENVHSDIASLNSDVDSCQTTVQEDDGSGADLSWPWAKLSVATIDRTDAPNPSICGFTDVDNTEMGNKNSLLHAEPGMEVEVRKEKIKDENEDENPADCVCVEGVPCQETLRISEKLSEKLSDTDCLIATQAGSHQYCLSMFGPKPCLDCTCVSKSLDRTQTKKTSFGNDMENCDTEDKMVEYRGFDETLHKNKELNAKSEAVTWPQKSIHESVLGIVEDILENLLRKIGKETNFDKAPEFPSCDIDVISSDLSVSNVHEQKHFVGELNAFNIESVGDSDCSEPNHLSSQLITNVVEVLSSGCGFTGETEQLTTCRQSDFCSEVAVEGQNFVTNSEISVEDVDNFAGEPSISESKDCNDEQSKDGKSNDMSSSNESQQKMLVEHPACEKTDFITEFKDEQKEPINDLTSISDQGFDDEHYAGEQENVVSEVITFNQIDFYNRTYISGKKKQMLEIESAEQNYFISELKGLPRPMEDISNQSWHTSAEKSQ